MSPLQNVSHYTLSPLDPEEPLVPSISSFLLGGRTWIVEHINHDTRSVQVTAAPRGKKPSWGGFAPQLLGSEICQQIAATIQSQEPVPYLDPTAQVALHEYRADLQPFLQKTGIHFEGDRAVWWTFAGGQINHTLKYGLQFHHDWKVVADNVKLKIEGESLGVASLNLSIEQLANIKFWHHSSTQASIQSQLPQYRLSKFQQALPEMYALEMIHNYLLDIPATIAFLGKQA